MQGAKGPGRNLDVLVTDDFELKVRILLASCNRQAAAEARSAINPNW
jgi:hypothetical protein